MVNQILEQEICLARTERPSSLPHKACPEGAGWRAIARRPANREHRSRAMAHRSRATGHFCRRLVVSLEPFNRRLSICSLQCPPSESLFTPYSAPQRSVICPRISHSSGKNLCLIPSSRISTGRPFSDFDPNPIVR